MVNIIFKFDDLTCISAVHFYIVSRMLKHYKFNRKVYFGLIGSTLEKRYFNPLFKKIISLSLQNGALLFNHGYLHKCDEFDNNNYTNQFLSIKNTQDLVKKNFNITLRSFGAPCNKPSDITLDVIADNFPEINMIFLCPNSQHLTHTIIYNTRCDFEVWVKRRYKNGVIAKVDFEIFKENYLAKHDSNESLVLQGHPFMWGIGSWIGFRKILLYLKEQDNSNKLTKT